MLRRVEGETVILKQRARGAQDQHLVPGVVATRLELAQGGRLGPHVEGVRLRGGARAQKREDEKTPGEIQNEVEW